jgi:hypothetical protein
MEAKAPKVLASLIWKLQQCGFHNMGVKRRRGKAFSERIKKSDADDYPETEINCSMNSFFCAIHCQLFAYKFSLI